MLAHYPAGSGLQDATDRRVGEENSASRSVRTSSRRDARTQKSERTIINGDFDFSVFSTGEPLNFRNELLLMKLRRNRQEHEVFFNMQLRSAGKSEAKRKAGEAGCRKRKVADGKRKGESTRQQQAAGKAGGLGGGAK
jgi:hypothetical protein